MFGRIHVAESFGCAFWLAVYDVLKACCNVSIKLLCYVTLFIFCLNCFAAVYLLFSLC